jgi:N-acetylmuramic acid 6-phosphate etherase
MTTTESSSYYSDLDKMSVRDLLVNINKEDKTVPTAIEGVIPQIEALVNAVILKMQEGGRLFYIGAGTSGRLGVVDASEIPPTYGMPHGKVVGIIAGGDSAIRKAVEYAEDDSAQAWKDLQAHSITNKDVLIGIAASGRTPYVIGGLKDARTHGLVTGCVVCNINTEVGKNCDYPVEVFVGPEFVTGSTRMKAGTAQKLILNMLSTSVMIRLGKVKGNKMVDMQLTNNKLVDRGTKMVMEELGIPRGEAEQLLKEYGSVRKAVESHKGHARN